MDENMTKENEIISGEECTIINTEEIQSINLNGAFSKKSVPGGWRITVKTTCDVTINYQSTMRKTDIPMVEGDQIERDGDTLFLIKQQPTESYQERKSTSPLSISLEKLRSSSSPVSAVDSKRQSPVLSPLQPRE